MRNAPVSLDIAKAPRRPRPARALVMMSLAASLLTVALAAPAQAATPRENEAAKLFFAGQYPEALKIYVDLAVATGDPAYMCEIGRCYSRMGKAEEASRNLRDCLSQAKLTPKKKREFQALQTEVEAARAATPPGPPAAPVLGPANVGPPGGPPPGYGQVPAGCPPQPGQGGYPPGPPPPGYGQAPPPGYQPAPGQPGAYPGAPPQGFPPPPGGQVAAGGPPPGYSPAPGQSLPPGAPPANAGAPADNQLTASTDSGGSDGGGSWLTPAAYVAGSVGVLGAAGGVVAGLLAKQKFDDVEKEYNDAKHKNAKTLNTLQYVGYGVGAAGIGTAIVLFILAPSSSESAASGVRFVASPNSFGLAGTF